MVRFPKPGKKAAALVGAACLLAILLVLIVLLKWKPGVYRPVEIPRSEHQKMRNHLVAAEQAFTENLRADAGPFTYHIYQDDLNRWLAIREEIYPGASEWLPRGLSDPFILFEDGLIVLMGRYNDGMGSVLLSMELTLSMDRDDLVMRVVGLRCGALGLPHSFIDDLSSPVDREAGDTWPGSPAISGDLESGLRLNAEAWWICGGIAYRVLDVSVVDGRLDFEIEPLGPRVQRRTKRQTAASASD